MINNEGLGWVHGVFGRGMKWGRQWIVTKVRGKNWKSLKTNLFKQNMRYLRLSQVVSKLPGLVARALKAKNLKILSKCFSQLDLPPMEKSPNWVARNIKNPNFEKYSKYFLWLFIVFLISSLSQTHRALNPNLDCWSSLQPHSPRKRWLLLIQRRRLLPRRVIKS